MRRQSAAGAGGAFIEPLEGRQLLADVAGLTLINAATDRVIGPLNSGGTIDLRATGSQLSVRTELAQATKGSVVFTLDGRKFQVENFAPYAIRGDTHGDFNSWTPSTGSHTLKVAHYTGANGTGVAGRALTVNFTVTSEPASSLPLAATAGNAVTALTLINAATDRVIGPLASGGTINLGQTGSQLSIRAETTGSPIRSVVFTLDGVKKRTENAAPYAIAGDTNGDYLPWTPSVGQHTLTVTPFSGSNGTGMAGQSLTVRFSVTKTTGTSVTPTTPRVSWSGAAPRSPLPRTESQVVQVGSKIYAVGGFTTGSGLFPVTRRVHSFDMATGRWQERAPLPTGAATTHGGIATDGRYIYLVAGQVGSGYGPGTNRSYRYDTHSNTWTRWVDLPQVRFGGALALHDGNLHFFGGNKADRETIASDHWMIDLSNPKGGWVRKASLPLAGDHMSHAVINGIIYAIGGEHGHHSTDLHDDADYVQHKYLLAYNPRTNTWTRKADMPIASSHFEGGTYVINGKIVLVGGMLTGGGSNTTSAVRFYDPATNRWTTVSGSYPRRVIGQTGGYWNGRIYSTNGYSPDSTDRQKAYWGTVSGI